MRLSRQFQACLFFLFTKRFRAQKNTSQAKINYQNKNKLTLNNKGNNFSGTQSSKRVKVVCFTFWSFLCAWNLFVKKINRLEIVLIISFYYTTVGKVFIESSQNLLEACNFINKETLAQVFSCEFYEFLRTPFFTEHLLWLLPFRYMKINAFIRQHFQTNYWPLSCMMVVSKFSGKVIFMFIIDLHGQNSNFLSTIFIEKFDISKACV